MSTLVRGSRIVGVALLSMAASFGGVAAAADAPPAVGSLVIVGGGLRPETAEIWQRIVGLAGGAGSSIAVFGSASAEPEASAASVIASLDRHGARAFFVPVAVALKGRDFRADARDARIAADVRAARGVFFTGGDQGRITKALVADDGSRTAVLDAVWDVYRRGGVIAGTSAGAAIMSRTMFYEPDESLALLRNGLVDGRDVAAGLGFVGPRLFVDQHCLVRGRFARMLSAMLAGHYLQGLCIDENTAAVVTDGHSVEIVGRSGAVLLALDDAHSDASLRGLNVRDARISLLAPDDRYDVATGKVAPARAKLDGRIESGRRGSAEAKVLPDILAKSGLTEALVALVESGRDETIGLAADFAATEAPATGFAFHFRKTAATAGYRSDDAALDGYTIIDVGLDVDAVVFAVPLYRKAPGPLP